METERKQASRLKEVTDDYQFSKVAVYGLKFLEEIVFGCALRKTSFFCNENRKWSTTFLVVYVKVVVNAPEEWRWRNIWRRDICLGSLLGKRDQSYVMWVCVRDRFEDLFTGRLKTLRQSKIVTFYKFGLNLRWKLK